MTTPIDPRRIAIFTPMTSELAPVRRAFGLTKALLGDREVWASRIGDVEVVAVITGIGTDRAAAVTEALLDATPVGHALVCGVAGGVGPTLSVGDLFWPELALHIDTGEQFVPTPLPGVETRGVLATSGEFHTDAETINGYEARGAIAIDMETAAVAAVCARRGVPWSAVRAISDPALGGADDDMFHLLAADGSPKIGTALRYAITHPRKIPFLARTGRDATSAARRAAAAARSAVGTALTPTDPA